MVQLINASYTLMEPVRGDNLLTGLELATRNCYKSEDKICRGSAERLLKDTIFPRKHYSVLEHGHILLKLSKELYQQFTDIDIEYADNNYIKEDGMDPGWTVGKIFFSYSDLVSGYLVSGNIRSFNRLYKEYPNKEIVCIIQSFLVDNHPVLFSIKECDSRIYSLRDIEEISPETITEEEQILHVYETARLIVNRGITHELVRHRFRVSYSQESTRYVSYADGIICIDPRPSYKYDAKMSKLTEIQQEKVFSIWMKYVTLAEQGYKELVLAGLDPDDPETPPQMARDILPHAVKADIIVTSNLYGWKDIFRQRARRGAHPQMLELMPDMNQQFKNKYPFYFK